MKLKTKTQNLFCGLNENLTTFLYTLTLCHPDKKTKCTQKSNVIKKKIWVLVFSFTYLVLFHVKDRSFIAKSDQKQKTKNGMNETLDAD